MSCWGWSGGDAVADFDVDVASGWSAGDGAVVHGL